MLGGIKMYENVEEFENLNEKQQSAINLLVLGKTTEEISKELNINANTIYRWKKNNLFKQTLRDKQDIIFDDLTYKIGSIGVEALNTLYDLMKNATNENNKIKVSMFIIDKLFQIKENDTIRKIQEIEYALQSGIRK